MNYREHSLQAQKAAGKDALKKAILFSLPLFILNFIIVSHVIHDIGLPYFLSHYQVAFYLLFNIITDFILFNVVSMIFHRVEHHRMITRTFTPN